jgi:hypothetical protein
VALVWSVWEPVGTFRKVKPPRLFVVVDIPAVVRFTDAPGIAALVTASTTKP